MARFPTDELERLKRETDMAALVRARGVELKRHGKDLLGLCPFHDDKEPSLVVTPSKGLWNCLGACGEGGTVVDWVMKTEGVSFRHAGKLLREGLPSLAAAPSNRPVKTSTVPKLPCPLDEKATDYELLDQVVDFYHETLLASPEALAYLEKRGIADDEVIRRFRLGYANRTLGLRLPKANRRLGAELRGRLAEMGVLRKSGHEHLAGSVTVPVFDEQGDVAELYGRKINDSLRKGTAYHTGNRRGRTAHWGTGPPVSCWQSIAKGAPEAKSSTSRWYRIRGEVIRYAPNIRGGTTTGGRSQLLGDLFPAPTLFRVELGEFRQFVLKVGHLVVVDPHMGLAFTATAALVVLGIKAQTRDAAHP